MGEGICHEVYEAVYEDPSAPAATYALKRIARHAYNEQVINDFNIEQQVTANTEHPHLIKAIKIDSIDNKPYMLMPRLVKERFEPSETAGMLLKIAEGLDKIHKQGHLHCDVSLKNILFDMDHTPILIDFSATTQVGQKQGDIKGTHESMSPEQVKGEILHSQSDLFSLAVVAWEKLSSKTLFKQNAPHLTVVAVVENEVPPSGLGQKADLVFKKALSKIPSKRHDTCVEFISNLMDSIS